MNHFHRLTRARTLIAVLALAAVPAVTLTTASASGTAPTAAVSSCPHGWGSLPKASTRAATSSLTNVRAGRHACYDRLVLDLNGRPAGYDVRYVPAVYEDASGRLVPLRGGAKLQIIVRAPAYNQQGQPTYRPANRRELVNVSGYSTFRQVAYAGSFEGQTTIGLGVRARLPFRVSTLAGPGTGSRIVIDVAHHW